MKIAIVGYGQMGKMIEEAALSKGIKVVSTIDPINKEAKFKELNFESVKDADVCIDFTHPSVIMGNIKKYCELKKNVVIGTTGWYDNMNEVKSMVKKAKIGFIWSGNFSIGVNMYFRIIEEAAKIVNRIDDYDIMGVEYHHNKKADSPSGTMKMVGDLLLKNIDRKKTAVYQMLDRQIKPDEIHLASVRGGAIPGIHEIAFDSNADTITITHSARTREGFAKGAIMAAIFVNKKSGFFGINELMKNIVGGK
jgi:4-hydroxy-tetrahydrodipicolinate reductase